MNIKNKIVDYYKNKKEIDKWIAIKGEQKYCEFAKMLEEKSIEITWKKISNLYRYDKRLLINCFKYMSFFEEYLRALLWNNIEKQKYEDYNDLNLFELINKVSENQVMKNGKFKNITNENFDEIRELRNCISHNKIILHCSKNGKKHKEIINEFYNALPGDYKKGFCNDIIKCEKDLLLNNDFIITKYDLFNKNS